MVEWREHGVILSCRKHGENAVIADIFFCDKGRHAGLVRGGTGRKLAPVLQPGTQVDATWSARLDTHLGQFRIEPIKSRTAAVLHNRLALHGLSTLCAMLRQYLPERDPHPQLYRHAMQLFDLLDRPDVWALSYLHWEMHLLRELGYGLDLSACAVRGTNEDLCFISPRTGRAVSRQAAGEWADRMLPLEPVLIGQGNAGGADIARALDVTGYFIAHKLSQNAPVPAARQRLCAIIAQNDRTGPNSV